MTVTLDDKTLNVSKLEEKTEIVYSTSDVWESGAYKRKIGVVGTVRKWSLLCTEDNVTWANSNANYFQTVAKNNTEVVLTITEPPHNISIVVHVIDVNVAYEPGTPGHRIFSIVIQELTGISSTTSTQLYNYATLKGETALTFIQRNFSAYKWNRLCLPNVQTNNQWRQNKTYTYGNPWLCVSAMDGSALHGNIAQISVLSPANVWLHPIDYSTSVSQDNPLGEPVWNWQLDKVNKMFSFQVILDNDNSYTAHSNWAELWNDSQTAYWTGTVGGVGSIGAPTLTNDAVTKAVGTDSLKIVIPTGAGSEWYIYHDYGADQDYSVREFIVFQWYGTNSGATINLWFSNQVYASRTDCYRYSFSDNFTGWRIFVVPKTSFSNVGTPTGWNHIRSVFMYGTTTGTWYLDQGGVCDGQWVTFEVRVPDTLLNSMAGVKLHSWNGSVYIETIRWNPEVQNSWTEMGQFYYLDGTYGGQIYPSNSFNYLLGVFTKGTRGQTKTAYNASTAPAITYSSNYGVQQHIGFAIKMPPDDGRDSSTDGISQCRLKIEIYYAGSPDGATTYEFSNDTNQYTGLGNINKLYIMLFKSDVAGVVDFLQLESGLSVTSLTLTTDHNGDISQVVVGFGGQEGTKRTWWGQDSRNPAIDNDSDGVPDVIEAIETYVDGGGFS
ncbi:MAG: hypothetical protein M1503_10120 [Thaumarchaeota archaeon]|nr:hypothetical protein [Nitrososphaerota archaeon]MCL5318597.1 hypothetical protein [Nitrososphaerota archaeon]